jgi:hypothetical protein
MSKLLGVLSSIIAMGGVTGGFQRRRFSLSPGFDIKPSRSRYKPHQGENEAKRRYLQHTKAGHIWSEGYNCWVKAGYVGFDQGGFRISPCESALLPHPHAAKFPPGTPSPVGRKNKLYYRNPKHVEILAEEFQAVPKFVLESGGTDIWIEGMPTYGVAVAPKRIVSGIKWRHLNER